jgi:hypothetical protein
VLFTGILIVGICTCPRERKLPYNTAVCWIFKLYARFINAYRLIHFKSSLAMVIVLFSWPERHTPFIFKLLSLFIF